MSIKKARALGNEAELAQAKRFITKAAYNNHRIFTAPQETSRLSPLDPVLDTEKAPQLSG